MLSTRIPPDGEHGVRVWITGELDMCTAAQVSAAARDAVADHPREVLLDLRRLEFLDVHGIRTLLLAQRDADARGITLRIINAQDRIGKLLDMTGVRDLLEGRPPQ